LLNERGIAHTYREYTQDPLDADEIRGVLAMLDCSPRQVLRRNDKAYRELGLTGRESDEVLVTHMAEHPTLLQRPIGIVGDRAAVGRPPEDLLGLLD
jgi:arsenate reductase